MPKERPLAEKKIGERIATQIYSDFLSLEQARDLLGTDRCIWFGLSIKVDRLQSKKNMNNTFHLFGFFSSI